MYCNARRHEPILNDTCWITYRNIHQDPVHRYIHVYIYWVVHIPCQQTSYLVILLKQNPYSWYNYLYWVVHIPCQQTSYSVILLKQNPCLWYNYLYWVVHIPCQQTSYSVILLKQNPRLWYNSLYWVVHIPCQQTSYSVIVLKQNPRLWYNYLLSLHSCHLILVWMIFTHSSPTCMNCTFLHCNYLISCVWLGTTTYNT